jgi:hypothetical protein
MRLHNIASFAILVALLIPCAVYGVDGVILIDQNKALAGNVTPGDTPGFPVTISQPGSYRLDSNLTVPDVNTSAITIAADNVTIDLNGFAILGNNVCGLVTIAGVTFFSCVPGGASGIGNGIDAHGSSVITIRNGTVRGMGGIGILCGASCIIEQMHVTSNGYLGIVVNGSGIVRDNIVSYNQIGGIQINAGALVSHNFVDHNHGIGIFTNSGATIISNVVGENVVGLILYPTTSYISNTIFLNASDNISGGVNLGQNLCDLSVCP